MILVPKYYWVQPSEGHRTKQGNNNMFELVGFLILGHMYFNLNSKMFSEKTYL